jgi:hypothetical protein
MFISHLEILGPGTSFPVRTCPLSRLDSVQSDVRSFSPNIMLDPTVFLLDFLISREKFCAKIYGVLPLIVNYIKIRENNLKCLIGIRAVLRTFLIC